MGESSYTARKDSPKSSPAQGGGRSPIVTSGGGGGSSSARQDSSGTLKTTISLGKNPSIVHSGPFYLMKEPPPDRCGELTGAANLMAHYGLEHSYAKFSGKKLKEQLSAFLPSLPGVVDGIGGGGANELEGALRSVIERPPVCNKELLPLTNAQLAGFRLHPGPLPDLYRRTSAQPPPKRHRSKHKKSSRKDISGEKPPPSSDAQSADPHLAPQGQTPGRDGGGGGGGDPHENRQKHKKQKRHDDDKERRKRKKEKKRKKQKHSPDHSTAIGGGGITQIPPSQ